VHEKCAFLRECGFGSAHFAAECGEASGTMLTTNAVQVAGLGRIYFGLLQSRRHGAANSIIMNTLSHVSCPALDYSLFVLLYWDCTYAAKKNQFELCFPKIFQNVHKLDAANIAFTF
jgi:hypothetical protein